MLIMEAESLKTNTTFTAGASAQILAANPERNSSNVSVDSAATAPVYLLLGTGTASAVNFSICLAAGQQWNGVIGVEVVWGGPVQMFSAAGGKVGVVEA